MNLLRNGNVALAFLLEVCAVILLGYGGFSLPVSRLMRVILGLGSPLLLMLIWGIWCAPSSANRLDGLALVLLKCLLFGLSALSLIYTKHPIWAIIFILLVGLNLGLSACLGTL